MAFPKQPTVAPESVGHIQVVLFDPSPNQPTGEGLIPLTQSATAEIHVQMSDGSTRLYRANIAEHFPATTINQLKNFVASVRSKANAEIL